MNAMLFPTKHPEQMRSKSIDAWHRVHRGIRIGVPLMVCQPHNKQLQRSVMEKVSSHMRQHAAPELRRYIP